MGEKIRNSQIFRKISQDKQYHQLQTRFKSVKSKLGFLTVRSVHHLGVKFLCSISFVSPWIVEEMDRKLAGVSVETYLRFAMSRVLRTC